MGSGPTMLILHYAKDHEKVIVVILSAGSLWKFPNRWHFSHFLMSSNASPCIVGQK